MGAILFDFGRRRLEHYSLVANIITLASIDDAGINVGMEPICFYR